MRGRTRFALALCLASLQCLAVPAEWQIGEGAHPRLGSIRFASPKTPFTTPVGSTTISSRAYVSCERASGKIAIEIAHATAPDDRGGLQPKTLPVLTCRMRAAGNGPAQAELPARWAISEIGDVLARGFLPPALRRCASIEVVQDVKLPRGWARDSAQVRFAIDPYGKELDSIFVTCGGAPAPRTEPAWKPARTVSSGRTNVRARPTVNAPLVVQLHPGTPVLVQPAGGDWWRVRPSAGAKAGGYVREDRLVFK